MKVHLRSIYPGGAWVEVDGEIIGNVTRTDEGWWWANWPRKLGEDTAYDIIGDYMRRRDAVAALVSRYQKEKDEG
jgi:hypothetical protein